MLGSKGRPGFLVVVHADHLAEVARNFAEANAPVAVDGSAPMEARA
jgi:hypothetical protein